MKKMITLLLLIAGSLGAGCQHSNNPESHYEITNFTHNGDNFEWDTTIVTDKSKKISFRREIKNDSYGQVLKICSKASLDPNAGYVYNPVDCAEYQAALSQAAQDIFTPRIKVSSSVMPKNWTLETAPTITSQGCSLFEHLFEDGTKLRGIHSENGDWSYIESVDNSEPSIGYLQFGRSSGVLTMKVPPKALYKVYEACMQAAATRK